MDLRGRRINNFLESWCLVASGGLGIWVSSTSFQKSNIGWPQQPPTEKLPISVKIWIFDNTFYKKGLVLVILVPGMIQPSGLVFFWWNEAVNVIEATKAVEAVEVTEAAEVLRSGKSLLRTSESSRFLNSALFWCLEKNYFLKYHIEI